MTLFRVQSYGCTAWGWLPLMSHCWLRAACGTRNELELSPRRVVDWESRDAGYRDIPTSLPPPIAVAAQAVPARPACAHSDSRRAVRAAAARSCCGGDAPWWGRTAGRVTLRAPSTVAATAGPLPPDTLRGGGTALALAAARVWWRRRCRPGQRPTARSGRSLGPRRRGPKGLSKQLPTTKVRT
jgi:hypothetical protein|eukprot:COSAG02_NODE_14768_length_1238_cov_1.374012_1_plen_184_part_00